MIWSLRIIKQGPVEIYHLSSGYKGVMFIISYHTFKKNDFIKAYPAWSQQKLYRWQPATLSLQSMTPSDPCIYPLCSLSLDKNWDLWFVLVILPSISTGSNQLHNTILIWSLCPGHSSLSLLINKNFSSLLCFVLSYNCQPPRPQLAQLLTQSCLGSS